MKLSFHGADRDVTGSCHLVECAGKRVLIDCGLFQGGRELNEENAAPFGFDASAIDLVLLTHAHLDHCGRLPLLDKRGFRGEIITTGATRELARLVMLDAAHLQEEDAEQQARRAGQHGDEQAGAQPLYTVADATNCLDKFKRTASYDQPLELFPGVRATFIDAGHILGSASIVLDVVEAGRQLKLIFSGDLGNKGRPLLRGPATPPKADVAVIETTYGDRLHKPLGPSIEEFYGAITDTFRHGGNVVIPTFALERAQELLSVLHHGIETGHLAKTIQVFLDSPMAISATEVFKRFPESLDDETAKVIAAGGDPLALPGLHLSRTTADSMAINRIRGGAVIMAGSGMCTGGRIRHHLKHNLEHGNASIVFVGYQGAGTLGRQIVDGAKQVRVLGEDIAVRARVYTINGFSAHADQAELLAWHRHTAAPRTFLTHGEEATMGKFAAMLSDTKVEMPALGQNFEL
ncbi:MAG: MBL fold metallo-hydrolase [Bradyrhizobiaceae bacterium]|nr:MBL fold metallo-hydrolase [Bradyrhizobiaceae bacterium]